MKKKRYGISPIISDHQQPLSYSLGETQTTSLGVLPFLSVCTCWFQAAFESKLGDSRGGKRLSSVKLQILVFCPTLLAVIYFEESSGAASCILSRILWKSLCAERQSGMCLLYLLQNRASILIIILSLLLIGFKFLFYFFPQILKVDNQVTDFKPFLLSFSFLIFFF